MCNGEVENLTGHVCDRCGKQPPEGYTVHRKYIRYPIECRCHSPKHFDLLYVCDACDVEIEKLENKYPEVVKIVLTEDAYLQIALKCLSRKHFKLIPISEVKGVGNEIKYEFKGNEFYQAMCAVEEFEAHHRDMEKSTNQGN